MRIDPLNAQNQATEQFGSENTKLRKVCREFESLLIAQIIRKMRDSIPRSDFFGSEDEERIFRDMLDCEIAKSVSESGAMKLADILYAQLVMKQKDR